MASRDGRSVIAYNGEVYNWRELRRELEADGVTFTSRCDTEVVLEALHRWGAEVAIPRFNGMFALAWFDRRDDTLWLARDRAGIKPLYLADTGSVVAFASEAKALFAHPAIPCRPDVHALVTNVFLQRMAGDWTGFEGVRAVLPGTTVRISRSGTEVSAWFDVERDVDVERILASRREPFERHVETFRGLIERSVELHLQSDAPLAVMCSGGLDSSLTTAIAMRHKPGLVAFVAEVEDAPVAEADKAQVVADHLGVALRRIAVTDADYPRLWALAAHHNDDPIFFYQNPMTLRVSEAVRDEGFKVLVTGEGADELFGGYPWQLETGRMWQLRGWHARMIPNLAPLRAMGRALGWLAPFDLQALAGDPFNRRGEWQKAPPGAELVIDGGIRRRKAEALFGKLAPLPSAWERGFAARAYDDFYHHLRVLLAANDKMTMATSVEMRVPFLESAVIDFGLHLAPRSKVRRGRRKRVVKAVAEPLLPREIVHAQKHGFGMPQKFTRGYTRLVEGGIVPELFKWGRAETARMHEVMREHHLIGQKVVSMELWAQQHFGGRNAAQMEERLRAVREAPEG